MKKTKKICSIILSIVILLCVAPVTVDAAEYTGKCGDNLTWRIDDSQTLVISGEGDMWDYDYNWYYNQAPWGESIEKVIITEGVTSIGNAAFSRCNKLSYAEISNSVTTIGSSAFESCEQLIYIEIPNSVTTIGSSAFCYCFQLETVIIGDGVETIGESAFSCCDNLLKIEIPDNVRLMDKAAFYSCDNLEDVIIGNGVEEIHYMAFQECKKLKKVMIGENVKRISDFAFLYCYSLEYIMVDGANKYYSNDEFGVLYDKDMTTLIQYPLGSQMTDYVVPDGVTTINSSAFEKWFADPNRCYEKLTKLTIPGSVETIDAETFKDCFNLTSVTIGYGTKLIDNRAFENCINLQNVVIADSVKTVGEGAFLYCNKLSCVYYAGSKKQWDTISIGNYNSTILNAKIHYDCRKVVTPPTCTEVGYVTYTCSCCDDGYLFGYIEPTGHIYTETQILPTCTAHGYIQYTCENCDLDIIDYTSNPTGHTLNEDGVCETCGEKEVSASHINTQMLSVESVLAMVTSLLAKLFGIFTVA